MKKEKGSKKSKKLKSTLDTAKHKIRFKKEPIWIKASFLGKYNGINFRFTYKEYTNDDAEKVIQHFTFKWPGRIPDNKEYAEKGIKELFLRRRKNNTLDYKVVLDEALILAEKEEQTKIEELINEQGKSVQEGFEGEIEISGDMDV